MAAICEVTKEIYAEPPAKNTGACVSMDYAGSGLRREEVRNNTGSSDWGDTIRRRYSEDNGRSWSDWEMLHEEWPSRGEWTKSRGENDSSIGSQFDKSSGKLIKPVFQRILKGDPKEAMHKIWSGEKLFWDQGFYQLSDDDGRTWSGIRQFKYEDGPDFDPDDWGSPAFIGANEMYIHGMTVLSGGGAAVSATVPVPREDPGDEDINPAYPGRYAPGCVAGAMCFVGKWNGKAYDWTGSQRISLPLRTSSRGLLEVNVNELNDGRLIMIMRGSNGGLDPIECPGRRWYSISEDGGRTFSEVTDLRYDTGEQFYSPSSICKAIRHSVTGKLYWFGNICDEPPRGNSPRYPLVVAEVDESIPALKKDTLTIIDARDPEKDTEAVQFSNFSVLEDRETHDIEVYLTRLGENGTKHPEIWEANAVKCTLLLG